MLVFFYCVELGCNTLFQQTIRLILNKLISFLTIINNNVTEILAKQKWQKHTVRNARCNIHPHSRHIKEDCKQKCEKHPLANHKNVDCKQGQQTKKVTKQTCPQTKA